MRFVYFGTDDFSTAILEKLMSDFYFPLLVVTQPDKPVGRKQVMTPPKIKHICDDHQIPVLQPTKVSEIKDQLKDLKPDFFIVASYGQIIPQEILNIPYSGAINVHTSLLPAYRGASPIQAAILDGLKETGITIMKMDAKMDHGPILFQQPIDISPTETGPSLFNKLAVVGAEVLAKCLPDIERGKLKEQPQDHDKATFTGIIKKADAQLDWTKDAEVLERAIRAYDTWPVAWSILPNNKRVQVISADIIEADGAAGEIDLANDTTIIHCGAKSLQIHRLKVEGSKEISGSEFAKGYQQFNKKVMG